MYTFNIIEIVFILLVHWVGDFVLQTDKQAKGKSKNWEDLLTHTMIYSLVWLSPVFIGIGGLLNYSFTMIWFVPITFVCHTITDYFTSKLNSKLYNSGQTHNFFVSLGADQIYHYLQLFLTYGFLKNL